MSNPQSLTAAALMRQLGFRFPAAQPVPAVRAAPAKRLLHVTNGDFTAEILRQAEISGEVAVTADVLHEGPVPGGLPPERWRKVRARYLAESGYADYDSALADLTRRDRALEDYRSYDEVVLWFEHDLFDQLLLIRTLEGFAGRNLGGTELSMICIGELPGVVPFPGLGQLSPAQMASLLPRRQRVNEGQKLLARDAWKAFCAPDPRGIAALLERDTSPLPFLAGAFKRHLEDLPWTRDGLARTERQILTVLAQGTLPFEELFHATQRLEERVYLGDLSFARVLRDLASSPRPLLRLEAAPSGTLRAQRVSSTATGREVLEGRDDWVRIRGIDRWLGGTHLQGPESPWRWEGETSRLVKT